MNYLDLDQHGYVSMHCIKCGKVHRAIRPCQHRFCPVCCIKRRIRVRNHLHALFKLVKQRPNHRLKMITLSCHNTDNLRQGVDHLLKSFRKLRNRHFWNKYVDGGIAVCEIKGRPHNYHPHLHIIVMAAYVPWAELKHHWQQVSGGTAVWIDNIPHSKAMFYVTKYVTKLDMPVASQDDPNRAMKGRHLFLKFGSWVQLSLPEKRYLFVCSSCGHSDWMSEFDILRYSHLLRGR